MDKHFFKAVLLKGFNVSTILKESLLLEKKFSAQMDVTSAHVWKMEHILKLRYSALDNDFANMGTRS